MIRLISGHICSGKTTYVRERARPGDVVIDLDRIADALDHEDARPYEHGEHTIEIARAARWRAIEAAVFEHDRRPGLFDLWIIHAYPSERDLAVYRRAGATHVELDVDRETLLARAGAHRPAARRAELTRRIEEENAVSPAFSP